MPRLVKLKYFFKCGDDDFSDDPDAADFIEYEDGSCVSVTTEVSSLIKTKNFRVSILTYKYCINKVVENGTDLTYQVGDCTQFGYQWTAIMDVDDPTEHGDFEYLSSMTKKQGCANPCT